MLDLKTFAKTVRISDGAWGTELQNASLEAGASPELLNVENPAAVAAVARAYVQAGSDVILTNTFGANRFILAGHGLGERTGELARAGAEISRREAGARVKVFASMGPTGKIVMMQEAPEADISAAFAEAAVALAEGGVDAILLESFAQLDEMALALRAVRGAVDLPVVASMTFASGPDGTSTMMGNSPGDLAALAAECGAAAVGANCGAGPEGFLKVARLFRAAGDLPIWIKPNAGLPQRGPDGKTFFPMNPQDFAAAAAGLIEAGANFLGGCCGTTPRHIAAVRKVVSCEL
ncbi:MAG: homocysteine S-methyltransferase family protein [Planctomycetaceae bacterium]|nr:homocysteine S-methyltransferase family protein [Planctomycetaceae bacterium]